METITYNGKRIWARKYARSHSGEFKRESWIGVQWKKFVYGVKVVVRWCAIAVAVGGAAGLIWITSALVNSGPVLIAQNVHMDAPIGKLAPVMQRIIMAESGGHQYNPKDGQVLMHVNTDGSVDLGAAQINSVWFKKASELGYDLSKEKDNIAFAQWLYANNGTAPWYSSAKNWK